MDGFPVFCGCCVGFNAQTMSTAQNFVGWRVEESTVGDYRGSAGNTCLMTFCVKFEKDGKKSIKLLLSIVFFLSNVYQDKSQMTA